MEFGTPCGGCGEEGNSDGFFVELPNEKERQAIWEIQIRRYGTKPGGYDLKHLARESDRMTGSEIEQAFIEALYHGFAAGKEPTNAIVSTVIAQSVPLAATMAEKIEALRNWAKSRSQMATSTGREVKTRGRKILSEVGRN